jgi:hypothetical protein
MLISKRQSQMHLSPSCPTANPCNQAKALYPPVSPPKPTFSLIASLSIHISPVSIREPAVVLTSQLLVPNRSILRLHLGLPPFLIGVWDDTGEDVRLGASGEGNVVSMEAEAATSVHALRVVRAVGFLAGLLEGQRRVVPVWWRDAPGSLGLGLDFVFAAVEVDGLSGTSFSDGFLGCGTSAWEGGWRGG